MKDCANYELKESSIIYQ